MQYVTNDTIVAIATPPGRGGVGIIRLSGPKAYAIALQLNGKAQIEPRTFRYSSFYINKTQLIDQGLMLYFKTPYSFTGEDVIEIQAHGSPVILDLLVKESILLGARLAKPGEFSERAFLNGKMDLTQAEAVADLIQASSETAARMAIRSLQGEFSNKINELNEQLIHLRLYVEAAMDFPEEEIDFLNDGKVSNLLTDLLAQLENLRAEANQGQLMREGVSIVIAGKPNVGKSTLINCLAGKEIAIVTDVAGTTRDVMREHILLDDIPVQFIDTAGLRESDCLIEQEGIKRALHELKQADCVLLVKDVNENESQDYDQATLLIQKHISAEVPTLIIYNKVDLLAFSPKQDNDCIYLSAKEGKGILELKNRIKQAIGFQPNEGQFIARRRHLQALDEAITQLKIGQEQLLQHHAGELLAEDLRLAHHFLCEITGEFSSDDLLGRIFSNFCIGK
ncbi:MAG: tRNA uridine-5-carboxymethylaminomethyl(34) synthesis GTPase MnmE [Legionella sp.]|nr:tRNA uridine-5-carboxymethylaminomethyl(34) synthesis GTPase MnmE [Legionella sp.]